jgi:hypothetical protein
MGFKSFLLLIIIVFLAIFSIQNLQLISLVFFGFKSLTFPLSFWLILSWLAGIISSLFVQFLSPKPRQKTNYNQSFSPPPPSNYPPSPPVQEKITPPKNNQRYTSSAQVTNQQYSEYDFDFLDEPQTSIDRDRQKEYNVQQPIKKQPVTDLSQEQEDSLPLSDERGNEEKTENIPVQKSSEETTAKSPVAEAPSEALLRTREASLYSYQPREKTEIKIPRQVEKTETNQRSINSTYSRRNDGIYDAPYRVIPPSEESIDEDNDDIYDDDEDDDWDF